MLLRASSQHDGTDIDLGAVSGEMDGDGGVAHGALLAAYAEAVVNSDDSVLKTLQGDIVEALGAAALIDSAAVAAMFNAIDRVADSTGIPIDEERLEPTAGFREELGISAFPSGRG